MLEHGFSEEEAAEIMAFFSKNNPLFYSAETVGRKMRNIEEYGFQCGVKHIVTSSPSLLGISEETLNARLDSLQKSCGSRDGLERLMRRLPSALTRRTETVAAKTKNLIDYGFDWSQIQRVLGLCTAPLSNSIRTINGKLRNLEEYGFSREEVIKAVVNEPMVLGNSEETTNSKLRSLEDYRYDKGQVREIVLGSSIFGLGKDTVKAKLRNLEEYGFGNNEARDLVLRWPGILQVAVDTINAKLGNLEKERVFHNGFKLALSKHEVMQLVLSFPSALTASQHAMGWKLRMMAVLTEGDKEEMIEKAAKFRFSARTMARRASYLRKSGYRWKHAHAVFRSKQEFRKRYGATI